MPTTVNIALHAQREIKRWKRKYPAVTAQIRKLVIQLENDERPGDKIPDIGYDVYKVRMPNPSAQRGKKRRFSHNLLRSGARHRHFGYGLCENRAIRHCPKKAPTGAGRLAAIRW